MAPAAAEAAAAVAAAAAAGDLKVGRTARGRDGRGRALLMLMPEELGFLKYLKQAKVRCRC
jgi:hypothetical protein